MADDSGAVRDGFVRQRRNLVGTSVAFFLYEKLGIVIDSINILGNTARITDPSSVTGLLWIAWSYFLLRYYQYFRDVPDKGFIGAYHGRVHFLARRVAWKKFIRSVAEQEEFAGTTPHFTLKTLNVYRAYTRPWELGLWEVEIEADVTYEIEGGVEARNLGKRKLNLSWNELAIAKFRSLLHVGVNTHFATEYFLPFLIAFVPVVYRIINLAGN